MYIIPTYTSVLESFPTLLHDKDTFSALLLLPNPIITSCVLRPLIQDYEWDLPIAINTPPKAPTEDYKIDTGHKLADTWVTKPQWLYENYMM